MSPACHQRVPTGHHVSPVCPHVSPSIPTMSLCVPMSPQPVPSPHQAATHLQPHPRLPPTRPLPGVPKNLLPLPSSHPFTPAPPGCYPHPPHVPPPTGAAPPACTRTPPISPIPAALAARSRSARARAPPRPPPALRAPPAGLDLHPGRARAPRRRRHRPAAVTWGRAPAPPTSPRELQLPARPARVEGLQVPACTARKGQCVCWGCREGGGWEGGSGVILDFR